MRAVLVSESIFLRLPLRIRSFDGRLVRITDGAARGTGRNGRNVVVPRSILGWMPADNEVIVQLCAGPDI